MTFTLRPGDYIPTSEVPVDKRQAVIDAFVAAGAKIDKESPDANEFLYVGWDSRGYFEGHDSLNAFGFFRRVTLDQILGEQSPSWDEVGPELLAALVELRKHQMPSGWYDEFDIALGKADEAIAKARSIK